MTDTLYSGPTLALIWLSGSLLPWLAILAVLS